MATLMPFFLFCPRLIVKVIGTLLILLIIIMAGSRGAFIGAVFGIAVYFAITHFQRFLILFFFGILISSVLIGGIDELKMSENKRVAEFAHTTDILLEYVTQANTEGASISVRQQLIKNGLNALYVTGGLGVGGGGSKAVQ